MYHIKDDKRAHTSAELIYQGLVQCLRWKPFDFVTIADVLRISGIGRATFYRNFDNLVDVLQMKCDQCFQEVLEQYLEDHKLGQMDSRAFLVHFFRYWMENRELLEILIAMNRQDIIYSSHYQYSTPITARFLPEVDTSSDEYVYFMTVRTSITVGVLAAWVKTGRQKTPEQLVELLIELGRQAVSGEIVL